MKKQFVFSKATVRNLSVLCILLPIIGCGGSKKTTKEEEEPPVVIEEPQEPMYQLTADGTAVKPVVTNLLSPGYQLAASINLDEKELTSPNYTLTKISNRM